MKIITHVDGIEVLERQQAYGTHPRWRDRQVPFSNVTELLLTNGETRYMCDVCGHVRNTIQSVVAHMGSHTEREPEYPVETLKAIIRTVKKFKNTGVRNYCELAAAELNRKGVATLNGEKWISEQVSRLYGVYKDKYRVAVPPQRSSSPVSPAPAVEEQQPPAPAPAPASCAGKPSTPTAEDVVRRITELNDRLSDITAELEQLAADVSFVMGERVAVDAEVIDKAKKYDELQRKFFS